MIVVLRLQIRKGPPCSCRCFPFAQGGGNRLTLQKSMEYNRDLEFERLNDTILNNSACEPLPCEISSFYRVTIASVPLNINFNSSSYPKLKYLQYSNVEYM